VNFFEHQDRARRQSRRLTLVFLLAVLAMVVAIDGFVLFALRVTAWEPESAALSLPELLRANAGLLAGGAVSTLIVIGLASLFRVASLRSGGGQVARQLGGTLVESDSRDPRRRRLRNVVEEIALASGVPVPEIYVLEQEPGINAFAAGYTPADAAVAVTRGALEKLSRNELQGVIAHEFSHILNGDMRLNIRLMGALFGILLLALIGRRVLIHARLGRSDRNGAVVVIVAVGLLIVGYIGLFCGRWIKAAVSRQREYLADASAVQFTRDPDSIGGALKKIAVYSDGSLLRADTEEISHMLFGDGQKMALFATHPPLAERIRRIDPGFREEDLESLRKRILREQARDAEEAERPARTSGVAKKAALDAGGLLNVIGNPDLERMLLAAAVAASLPKAVRRAAHSTEWAPEALFYALLDSDAELREQQLLIVSKKMGYESEAQVRALLQAGGLPAPEQKLPLLEIAFPALKRRPFDFISQVLDTVKALIAADGRTEVFEYVLARVISQYLWEAQNPHGVRTAGGKPLSACRKEAEAVLAVLASRGGTAGPPDAEVPAAFRKGWECLQLGPAPEYGRPADWVASLDAALPLLDRLKPADKARLVEAMATVVTADRRVEPVELELLRAACALIHVPLPLLAEAADQM